MAEENKETYRKLKTELEEKLRKLLAFNSKSPSFFSEVEVLKSSVDQGLAQAEKSWSPTSKTFNLPSRSDMWWASVIESIDAKYTAEKEKLKSENNNKLTDQEYDRVISQITGINGKPLFGASVIKNASPEEKKDLLLTLLPWIIPGGGTLRLAVASSTFMGGLDGIISGDDTEDTLKKMFYGGLSGYIGYKILSKIPNLTKKLKNKNHSKEPMYTVEDFREEMKRLPYIDLSKKVEDGLISTPNGDRPLPKRYLSKKEIDEHLKLFENGVVKIVSEESFDKSLKAHKGFIGPEEGHFVMPKFIYEKAVKASNGNPRVLEELLGFDKGYLGENPIAIEPKSLKFLRFPSGNEKGTLQGLWNPGGRTKGGIPEAVINQLAPDEYIEKEVYKRRI